MPLYTVLHHIFHHKWEDIALASWLKYPNPNRPDVLDYDIVDKKFDPETGVLTAKRIVWIKGAFPDWLARMFGVQTNVCCFVEDSEVNIKEKRMVLRGRNVTFSNVCHLEETCTYTPAEETSAWTSFTQEAKVVAFPYGLSSQIEKTSIYRFEQNAVRGRDLMEEAVEKVHQISH